MYLFLETLSIKNFQKAGSIKFTNFSREIEWSSSKLKYHEIMWNEKVENEHFDFASFFNVSLMIFLGKWKDQNWHIAIS